MVLHQLEKDMLLKVKHYYLQSQIHTLISLNWDRIILCFVHFCSSKLIEYCMTTWIMMQFHFIYIFLVIIVNMHGTHTRTHARTSWLCLWNTSTGSRWWSVWWGPHPTLHVCTSLGDLDPDRLMSHESFIFYYSIALWALYELFPFTHVMAYDILHEFQYIVWPHVEQMS